ncbi:TIR domain-containing protein [Mycobacterium sp. E2733]|uniref:nSTAND1 domain-containing NTPase n=1 Tax=Mycobacterium sp. E2733 TaxID=1834138 RepID=UPI0007FBDC75|nr:TIR domain-containing protein [Mycobacterium sp. E2733]OBH95466.1 hypothetical protein A5678_02780 [Mycobacterium sp. E2733]
MSRIFLSHSSKDNRQAVALKQWLVDQRPELANEIFLDIDAGSGLRVGARWKGQLFESNSRCEAVLCLVSAAWDGSHECRTEYRTAEGLGKQILVVRLEDTGDGDITSEWQRCDLFAEGALTEIPVPGGGPVRFNTAALYALRKAIEGAGVGPQTFVWPPKEDPHRAPYRGWEPFEDIDAGVFFGRDAAIVRGLDELRAMRLSGLNSLFVVLGPSGSGKSSFLRAGLIPRLQREDRRFVVLGIVRPQRNALTGERGLAAAIHAGRQALGLDGAALGKIKQACQHREVDLIAGWLAELRSTAAARLAEAGQEGGAPSLVLPLDQAEELFSADAGEQGEQFLGLVAEVIERVNTGGEAGLIVAATIRTDRYEAMQGHHALERIGTVLFNELKPMPPTQFEKVITGPADRAGEGGQRLALAPDLVSQLIADATEGADTLPLLALTLARLYADYASTGELTLADYQQMGGMADVVNNEIEQVLPRDPAQREAALELLRSVFVPWLATINPDNDQPMRRVAHQADLPEDSRPLIEALVEKRLLMRDQRDGQVVVEVALESLLRQWDTLAGWLRTERQHLKTADDIERNTTGWATHDHDPAWLLTGTRLADAETLAGTPGFSERLTSTRDYLAASRQAENQRLAHEEEQRQAELRNAQERQQTAESHAADLRRRAHVLRSVLAITAVIAVIALVGAIVAVVGFVQANHAKHLADTRTREAVALKLTSQGQAMLAGVQPGGDVQAIQQILAAPAIAPSTGISALLTALVDRQSTIKIIPTSDRVTTVAFSPDGQRMVSGSGDKTLRVWNAGTGAPIGTPLAGHTGPVDSVAFSPDGQRIVSGSEDTTLRLWNAETGAPIGAPLTGHTGPVTSVAFSPDGRRIVSAGSTIADGTVRLWDAGTGQQIGALLTDNSGPWDSVAFSPDGRRIVSGSGPVGNIGPGRVQFWDADTGQPVGQPLIAGTGPVFSVAYSRDGQRIVSGSADGTVRLWNAVTGQPVGQPLTVGAGPVFSVAYSRDGQRIVSGSADGAVRLSNADTGQEIGAPLTGHTDRVTSVAFAPDGQRIVSGSDDTTLRLWNAGNSTPIGAPLTSRTAPASTVAFSPDGHTIVSGGDDTTLRLWNADTGQQIGLPLTGHTFPVSSVAFSPDGHRIVSGSADATVRLWDAGTGREIGAPLTGHKGRVESVAFSPDGHRIVSSGFDDTLRLWNVDTGAPIGAPIRTRGAWSVAFSPDGHRIVASGFDNTVRLWDAGTGREIGPPLTGHTGPVLSVAFSPDGRTIVSGSDDTTVRLWDAGIGREIGAPLTGHREAVASVAFSPDGHTVVSGSNDRTLRLWDAGTGQQIGPALAGGTGPVAFSPDGRRIVSDSADGILRLWPGPAAWSDLLCDKLAANMSHRQWNNWVSPSIDYITVCPALSIRPD